MKKYFQPAAHSQFTSVALLLLRIVVGLAFMLHGWGKIQNPFGWMPDSPIPGFLQMLAAVSEFAGGFALIIGLLTPLASLGLVITMLVATIFHAFIMKDPFVSMGGSSYELALVYMIISLLFMATGPGKFSADAIVFKSQKLR